MDSKAATIRSIALPRDPFTRQRTPVRRSARKAAASEAWSWKACAPSPNAAAAAALGGGLQHAGADLGLGADAQHMDAPDGLDQGVLVHDLTARDALAELDGQGHDAPRIAGVDLGGDIRVGGQVGFKHAAITLQQLVIDVGMQIAFAGGQADHLSIRREGLLISPSLSWRKAWRARDRRDITVPVGTWRISATSL